MPRGSGAIRAAVLRMRLGEPIPTVGLTDNDRDRLVALTRERMEALIRAADAGPEAGRPARDA